MQQPSLKLFRQALLPAAIVAAGSVGFVGTTAAQEDQPRQRLAALEEIVVTAQRRQESLQDVPISVVALSADALEHRGVAGTIALPEVVPSVQYTSSGPSGIFFIRGVGNTNAGFGEEGANAFYVDGVFMPDLFQSVMEFNNIDRVEVLKGPQGTLFGRNSSGGLVHVITRDPTQETEARVKVGYANYDRVTTQAYVGGGLTDDLVADIAVTTADQGKGWGENVNTGSDVGRDWHYGVRSKAIWTPTDTARFTLAGDYMKVSTDKGNLWHLPAGAVGWSRAYTAADFADPTTWQPGRTYSGDGYDVEHDFPTNTRMRVWGASLTAEFDLDWATLTSITATRNLTNQSGVDVDNGPLPILGIGLDGETESWQQEFRLSSSDTEPFSWQMGVFYLNSTVDLNPQTTSGTLIDASTGVPGSVLVDTVEQKTESWAVFGEVGYALTPATRVTAGLRYTRDEVKLDGSQVLTSPFIPGEIPIQGRNDSATDREPTWRLAIRHDLTDNVNIYASYNRGFKSGLHGMNAAPWRRVEPQTIDAFEIGIKSELLDNRLRLNAAAFRYEIDDYQVRAVVGAGQQTLLNAAEVEVDGLEVEFEAIVVDGLSLFGSATYLKSEFADFPNAPTLDPTSLPFSLIGGGAPGEIDAKGNKTPLAPKFAGNIGASWRMPVGDMGELRVTGLYSYNDGYYFESDNRLKQPSFGLFNASVAYHPTPNWGVELWGRNLTDKRHYVQQNGQLIGDYAVRAAPRTYGVNLSYNF